MRTTIQPLLAALALAAVPLLGTACDGELEDARIENSCESYCDKAVTCDDETDFEECETDCIYAMENCDDDNLDAALSDLDTCAEQSCDDFYACTVGVGLECEFGI